MASNRQPGYTTRLSPAGRTAFNGISSARTIILGLARIIFSALPIATVSAAPISTLDALTKRHGLWSLGHDDSDDPDTPGTSMLVLYIASAVLVLAGGAFAGLTIALMGQDSIYLQVLSRDDTDPQQKNAKRVHDLLQKGKHWVLVTLLLSNVIVNETLPVVLDRCLGGGVAAVVGSTVLIVIFGEVLPQSICVRYGLQIGGVMAKPVLAMMWLMAPIAWPTAKILDHALGEDHGTVYKKSGLKTLVTLHRSLGEVSERLNQDEVTIISAVLDLKEKPVSNVMTPMDDVFTMSEDTVLDEKMMDLILSAGYSRIPIHEPENPTNFVGMLLVKILITYDPDDKMRVSEFPLATLPETRPETSCLDIVNFFQEGKSHMVLVSQYPGEDHGALGVVTLEDVIEELIGEEIIDESDVYIDVHKAIRRLQPAPRARPMRQRSSDFGAASSATAASPEDDVDDSANGGPSLSQQTIPVLRALSKADPGAASANPLTTTVMMRRSSTGADGRTTQSTVPVRANIDEMWKHLRHLGPSNRANNPKNTRSTTVMVKQGHSHASHLPYDDQPIPEDDMSIPQPAAETDDEDTDAGETAFLLGTKTNANGKSAEIVEPTKAADSSLHPALKYGTRSFIAAQESDIEPRDIISASNAAAHEDAGLSTVVEPLSRSHDSIGSQGSSFGRSRLSASPSQRTGYGKFGLHVNTSRTSIAGDSAAHSSSENSPNRPSVLTSTYLGDLNSPMSHRSIVRSGSITENVVETRGIRKVVLETTSSAEDDEETAAVMTTTTSASFSQRLSLLSGLQSGAQSPALPSPRASHADDKAVKRNELESALLAAKATATASGRAVKSIGPSASQTDSAGAAAEDDDDDGEQGEADGSVNSSSAAAGSSAAKKKNRRKKRKNAK
ncbi:hypothetical protein F503_08864 [Ophiostoma piceae UAMH 11346]|uniref:Duf21 and cbs domain protein n=1 Tax=Ophiostoma piceae (strain UAMH 11346) TaxID=1262450 RepID=S3BRC1_OPHP1|nr:hypothetical protein F503_08864 [Ophiostoma piceae UAMH 11346]